MPSGKSKSKENTWTEKELTDAIQGEKPRRSKDEKRLKESKDDRAEKRHSRERGEEDRDRRRHKSERHGEASLDGEENHNRRAKDDRDRERKHKDRNKERMKDEDNERDGSSDRKRERKRKERNGEEENEDDRRKHREKEERSKEKSRKHTREDEIESSRERRDERKRDKENRDKRSDRKKDEGEDHETERKRNKEKDEKRRERDREGDKDIEKRRRDKDERSKEGRRDEESKYRDRSLDDITSDGKKARRTHEREEDEDDERKRRRRKQEKKEARENNKDEDGSGDKDRRRKDKRDKGRSEEDSEDKHRRREDRERRKEKDQGGNERLSKETNDSKREVKKKETAGKLETNGRSLSINAVEVDEEIRKEDNYGEDNYEDDFEDYEDDFEDGDEDDDVDDEDDDEVIGREQDKGKLFEIFEAINAENEDVRQSPFQQATSEDSTEEKEKPVPKSIKSPQGRINFFAAKQKHVTEFVASKTRKRAQELKNLIELDVASYDIFDLPPLNEYELYIKSYGQSDSKQAYVQCHDDVIEKEIQTEVIEMYTKWTQHPPDDFKGSGEGDENREGSDLQENVFTPHSVDSIRLTNFLQQAGQVCLILLEEKNSVRKDLMFKERNDLAISDGFIQIASKLPFLEGRRVLDMNFNSVQTHLLLTAHDCGHVGANVDKNDRLQGRGIVCYWNVNEPSQPQKILYCECSPNSCCFSPVKSSLVFAGLEDGSVVVWDVRESSSLHSTINNKDNQWVVRRPTFSTAGVLFNENHLSPVRKILPIALSIDSAQALSRSTVLQDEAGGMAFQLASLDESGVVNIWVVIELEKPDDAGSENDLGLAPGGRVKLIKSTSIQVESPHRETFVISTIQTSVMQFSTLDPNQFYVGTDRGWVVHCTRYGGRTHPKVYRPETESFVTISAIDVSPWNIPIMLVGCTDGTLRLHDLRKEHAIRSWPESTRGSAIVQLMWSKSRPSFFFVLDANSNLYIWDLLQKDKHPIATESFKRGKLLFFSISNDYESLGIGLPGRKSELVLNYEGGIIELHRLKENLTNVPADELDRFASLVDSIF